MEKLSKKVVKNLPIKLVGDEKRRLEESLPNCESAVIMKYFWVLELAA